MHKSSILSICSVLFVMACSSASEGTNADGVSAAATGAPSDEAKAAALAYCQANYDNHSACDPDASREFEECKTKWATCYQELLREDALEALAACAEADTCTDDGQGYCDCAGGEDKCFYEAGLTAKDDPKSKDFSDACMAKRSACGGSFGDDWCQPGGMKEAYVSKLSTCLDSACGDIDTCFLQVISEVAGGACRK